MNAKERKNGQAEGRMGETAHVTAWDPAWDCRPDDKDGEAPYLVTMVPQEDIDGDRWLEHAQRMYRIGVMALREKEDWPSGIEEEFGTACAFALLYGLLSLKDAALRDRAEIAKRGGLPSVGDLEGSVTARLLPGRCLEQCGGAFLGRFAQRADALLADPDGAWDPKKPADEIVLCCAMQIADTDFEGLFGMSFLDLAFELCGDDDAALALYGSGELSEGAAEELGIDPDDYAFENWFEDRFWLEERRGDAGSSGA